MVELVCLVDKVFLLEKMITPPYSGRVIPAFLVRKLISKNEMKSSIENNSYEAT